MANQYTYVIMSASIVTDQQIDDCLQTSRDTLRLSLTGSQTVLKFITANGTPSSLQGLGLTFYTQDETISITTGSNWQ